MRHFFTCFAVTCAALTLFVRPSAADITVSAPASADIGQGFVVSMEVSGEEISDVRINWQGHEGKMSPRKGASGTEYSVLIGSDLKNAKAGNAPLVITFNNAAGTREKISHTVKLNTHKYPSEKLSVESSKVTPPAEVSKKIARETEMGRAAIQSNSPGHAPKLPLVRPVPGILTSVYGKSRYFNGAFRGRHGGADMRAKEGTPVKAAADGVVVLAGDNFYFAGNCVYIDHGAGFVTFYGHLSKINVKKGDLVKAGTVIGLSGNTGRVTGPHLHFSTVWRGEYFDPAPLMSEN